MTLNFLRVLLANYRMPLLEEAFRPIRKIANEPDGIVQVIISSASELSEAERESVAARFRELTGKQVELEFRIDSELLGGILAQIGSTVYDGSVRGGSGAHPGAVDGAVKEVESRKSKVESRKSR